jgi:EmrB/QacA subfamily drug resistance transporter
MPGPVAPLPSDAPGGEEVPVVAWPFLFQHRLHHRLRSSDRYRWWVLVAVLTGLFATGFTITILAVSLGTVAEDLGTSATALTWVVTGPLLGLALAMPLFGKLGDVWGHRRIYLWGFAGFTVGAALTALAWSGPALIAIRVLGSLPGAAIGPASMALIMTAFPEEDRVKAMGWWSLVGAGAPVIGLVAGGPVVDAIGWRVIFLAQVPLALAALVLASVVLRETPRREREPIDVAGAVTLAIATVAALLGLTVGADRGFTDPAAIALFAVAPVALVAFVRVERRAAHPLLPLGFFRRPGFTPSLVAQFWANFAYMGGFIVTPLLVERRFGFSVAATSLAMVCRPLSFSLSAPVAGYVAARTGERRAGLTGTILLALSMGLFVAAAATGQIALVFVALVLSGLGMGTSSPSLVTVVANAVPARDLGVANAAQQMVAQIGNVAGIQVLATVQGDSHLAGPFVAAYAVGALAAVLAVAAAAFVRDRAAAVMPPPPRDRSTTPAGGPPPLPRARSS